MERVIHVLDKKQFEHLVESVSRPVEKSKWSIERSLSVAQSMIIIIGAIASASYFFSWDMERLSLERMAKKAEVERLEEMRVATSGELTAERMIDSRVRLEINLNVTNNGAVPIDIFPAQLEILLGRDDLSWTRSHNSVFFANPPKFANEQMASPGGINWEVADTFIFGGNLKQADCNILLRGPLGSDPPTTSVFQSSGACVETNVRSTESVSYTQEFFVKPKSDNTWIGITFLALVRKSEADVKDEPESIVFRKWIEIPSRALPQHTLWEYFKF